MDWDKIDNDRMFQRLVNDLFAFELGKPGYRPSSPCIGADGGWDGRFDDPYLGLLGTSCVQSKWTQHNLSVAYKSLRRDVKEELEKAKTNGVENLFIVTNAKLKIGKEDHIGKLEQLKKDQVKNLFIYDREKLISLISRYPWLLHKYFGVPQRPLFAPYSDYLTDNEPNLFTDSPLLERRREIEEVKDFLSDNRKKILVIHAPCGHGKSRFLIEAAKILQEEIGGKWQSWFCRPSLRNIEDALQDEIYRGKNYLLFLDNAELVEDPARRLITALRSLAASEVKLILSCRTPYKDTVLNWITELRIDGYSTLELIRLREEVLVEIHRIASKNKNFSNREKIVKELDNNPFFIVSHAKHLSEGANIQDLKANIKDTIEETAILPLSSLGYSKEQTLILLRELSATVPFKLRENGVVSPIAKTIGKHEEDIRKAVDKLIEVGVLRYVGSSVRYSSDLNGNVYLSMVLDGPDGSCFTDELFQRWLPIIPNRMAANIASAGYNAKTSNIRDIANKLIRQLVLDSSRSDILLRRTNISWVRYLVFLAPEQVTNLVSAYIGLQSSSTEISRDDYGPVILSLMHVPGFQKQALDITRSLGLKNVSGTYSNYEVETLVRSAVSAIELPSVDAAINSLNVLDRWADDQNIDPLSVDLVLAGTEEALSGSHEYNESRGHTFITGRRSLVYSPKVAEYRDVALGVYKKILNNPDPAIQAKSISLFGKVGREAYQKSGPFWERILSDKQEILKIIGELIASGTLAYPALAKVEDALMRLWANNDLYPDLSTQAEEMLGNTDRSPEFLIYKLFAGSYFIIPDFSPVKTAAPTSNRWSWLVHNHMRRDFLESDDLSNITKPLSEKYSDPGKLVEYLIQLDTSIGNTKSGYIPLIESWARHNVTIIVKVIQHSDLFSKVPERFRDGFHSVAANNITNYINDFAKSLLSQPHIQPIDIDRLINLIIQNDLPPKVFMSWMQELVPKLNEQGIIVVCNRAYFMFRGASKAGQEQIIDLIELLFAHGLAEDQLDACGFLMDRILKKGMAGSRNLSHIKELLLETLRDVKEIDHREDLLLELIIGDDFGKLLEFIDYRLEQNKIRTKRHLDAIPYDGFKSMQSLIKNYTDFDILMGRVVRWFEEGLITRFDIEYLLKHSPTKNDDEHGNYLTYYIEQNLLSDNPENLNNAIIASYVLDFGTENTGMYLKVLEKTESTGLFKKAKDVFVRNVSCGSYSSTLGEPPPELLHKRDALIAMKDQAKPGQIRSLIDALIEDTNNSIQSHIDRDEELINPKD